MRTLTFLGLFFYTGLLCAQTNFEKFVSHFSQRAITDPVFNITTNKTTDFLNVPEIPLDLYNKIIIKDLPKYYLNNGTGENVDFLGTIDKEGSEYVKYDDDGNEIASGVFVAKVFPLARIDLKPGYITLVFSLRMIEETDVYMLNFNASGKLLSAIDLLTLGATFEEPAIFLQKPLLDFRIESDGRILQKSDGLDLYRERTFGLRNDGYFEVLTETTTER